MDRHSKRIAVVGHYTYFENHFPEGWRDDPDILCIDVNEKDYSWLVAIYNFRPHVTLFFRPELYPKRYIERISGLRVAILSEPIPALVSGRLVQTSETKLRLRVYSSMDWDAYHWRIFYDQGKAQSADQLGFPIDEYRPLPVDTGNFYPVRSYTDKEYDVSFIGKPTMHRIEKLDFLRSSSLNFFWVAHGLSGAGLADVFRRSKVVLNVHADTIEAFEPRVYLAAACGAGVFSEVLSSNPELFRGQIIQNDEAWTENMIRSFIDHTESGYDYERIKRDCEKLSARQLIDDVLRRFSI